MREDDVVRVGICCGRDFGDSPASLSLSLALCLSTSELQGKRRLLMLGMNGSDERMVVDEAENA